MPDPSDPYSGYNAMQAHMGVVPMQVQSPGSAAQMMVTQAAQQRVTAMSAGMPPSWGAGGGGAGAASMFGEQFRQRFDSIQSQQSYSPHMAQAMSGGSGYAPGMLPSPAMMTPPSTGVFRNRPEGPRIAPLPPQPMRPMVQTPFTPQLPNTMFQDHYDRMARVQDQQKDAFFSRAVQAPRVLGQGAGIGAAAALGGAIGGPLGAIGGGMLGQSSGFAQGAGNLAMKPFQPMIERRQMGASLRRSSQDWVVGGQDLHESGSGMSREASIRLAEEVQDLAKNKAFKKETGGAFNAGDLMKITQQAGKVGLMDESQDVEGVRKNIKNVSRTLRKYMQLTQDPDMVNVLRELGQMKQFGMTLDDMEQAATSMNRYSKAAGMSISGIKQMGMAGGATFQQAGLTAGSGMTYGMHAAASARQGVATGAYQPRELALMGGVQGMAQRNMQAQAAMISMPMFGAAASQFGAGGFSLNQGALGGMGQGGAQGMVQGAVGAMNQAVQRGGVGALGSFRVNQRRLQTEAAEEMTPEQMMAMRFQTALRTGQGLGLEGQGAFDVGAQVSFGTEIAEQMNMEARNPQLFQEQRNRIQDQRQRLTRQQRQRNEEADLGGAQQLGRALWSKPSIGPLGVLPAGEDVVAGGRAVGSVASYQAGKVGDVFRGIGESVQDIQAESEGRMTTRLGGRFVAGSAEERRNVYSQDASVMSQRGFQRGVNVDEGYSGRTVSKAMGYGGMAPTSEIAEVGGFLAKTSMPVEGALTQALGLGSLPAAGLEAAMGTGAAAAMGPEATGRLVRQQAQRAHGYTRMAKFAATKAGTEEGFGAALDALSKSTKGKANSGTAMRSAAGKISRLVKEKQNIILPDGTLDPAEVKKALRESLAADGMSEAEVNATLKELEDSGEMSKIGGVILDKAKTIAGPENAKIFDESIAEAQKMAMAPMRDKQAQVMERKENIVKALENQMDLTYDIGGVAMGEKAGAEEFRELLSEGPGAMLAKSVAAMEGGEGSAKVEKEAFTEYMKLYGKGRKEGEVRKEFDMMVLKAEKSGMSSDVKERLRGAVTGGEAGDVGESVKKLSQLSVTSSQLKQYGDVVGGGLATVMEAAGGEASGKLLDMAGKGDITGAGVAGAFSKKDIQNLARSGHKALAGKIARFQSEKDPDKKKALEQEIMEGVGELGEAKKKTEKELGEAEGKEAEDLDKSDKALAGVQGEMADAFKDFKPAVKTFADGADKLQKAMESDMFKKMIEGD